MKLKTLLAAWLAIPIMAMTAHAQQVNGTPGSPAATATIDGRYVPAPPQKFEGEINLNATRSKPAWPAPVLPPKGAPNVLLLMTDDQGDSVSGTFGGVIPDADAGNKATNSGRLG
jgi:hypothetical protein